jgi:ER-bound oxygenase mpaB/B'/Rubber oxygenase, catalytic domain
MPASLWTDSFLDEMRETADPPADRAIRAVFEVGDLAAVQGVLNTLTRDNDIVPGNLPAPVREYLEGLPSIPEPERPLIIEGQELFTEHGPEILMILGCYSLPAAYAARKGVQVLYRTGYLQQRTNMRLFQTSQMVIDVMTPGGLGPKGQGRITAQKVRLMHAAIRHLLQSDPANPWPAEFGVPINQEDLAGTLMTFTHVIRDGLNKLGVSSWPPGYLNAWQAIGRILGIVPELIPATPDEATELCAIIDRRQISPSPEGRALTSALLQMLEHYSPPGFKRMPAALMRHFLPGNVADGLGVPVHRLDEELVNLGAGVERLLERIGPHHPRLVFRAFGTHVVEMLIKAEVGPRPEFRIPTELHDSWQLSKA